MLDLFFARLASLSRGLLGVFISQSGQVPGTGVGVAAGGGSGLDEVPLDKNIRAKDVCHGSGGFKLPPARQSRQEAEQQRNQDNAATIHPNPHRNRVFHPRGVWSNRERRELDRVGPRVLGSFDACLADQVISVIAKGEPIYLFADGDRPRG